MIKLQNTKFIGYSSAIIAASLLGSTGIFIRNIDADIYIVNFLRLVIGLFFLLLFLFIKQELYQIRNIKISFPLMLTGACLALLGFCYMNAINNTSLANAVFLLYLAPLIAIAMSVILLNDRFTIVNVMVIFITFIGFLFLLEFRLSIAISQIKGYLWGISAAIFYALFIVFNKKIHISISGLNRCFYQLLFGTIIMAPLVNYSLFNVSMHDFLWIVAMGFVQGFLAFAFAAIALKYLTTYEYGVISYIEPLTASLIGVLLYSESSSLIQIFGYILIFLAGIVQIAMTKMAPNYRLIVY